MQPESADNAAGGLWANAAWGGSGGVCYAAGRFVVFVLLAKFLTVDQVGQFALSLAIVTPIAFLLNAGLRLLLVTDTTGHVRPGDCLAVRTLTNAALLAIIAALAFGWGSDWPGSKRAVLLGVAGIRVVENWADIYLGVMQKSEKMKYVSISHLIKSVGIVAGVAMVLLLDGGVVAVLSVWLAVTALALWFYDMPQAQKLGYVSVPWSWAAVRKLMLLGLPLGAYITLSSFNDGLGRYFLSASHGDQAVGYFAGLAMVVTGLGVLVNGVNQALMPPLAREAGRQGGAFWALLLKVLAVIWIGLAALALVVWQWGSDILRLLYRSAYAEHADVFLVVVLGGALLLTAMTLGDALVAAQRFKHRLAAVAAGLLTNAGLCWLWVGPHGLAGAAWAAVLGSAVASAVCAAALSWPVISPDATPGDRSPPR